MFSTHGSMLCPDGTVLLTARDAGDLARALVHLERANGITMSPSARTLHAVLVAAPRQAQRVAIGRSDVRTESEPPSSGAWLTTNAAADLLGISPRQCTRLIDERRLGEARKVRGRWEIPLHEVEAYAQLRETTGR